METQKSSCTYQRRLLNGLASIICLVFAILSPLTAWAGEIADRLAECARIGSDAARLKCFDDLSGRKTEARTTAPSATAKVEILPDETEKPSVMSTHWELDSVSRKAGLVIRAHRPNYFLPAAHNSSPNRDAALDVDQNARPQNTEGKFQISFKVKLWEDIMDKDMDLWFGYTQLSFWQLYNKTFSSPFRETDYEPEVLLNFRTNYDLFGLKGRTINVGVNHQSNGRSGSLSRSWNRLVANFGFEKDAFNLLVKTWYRVPESARDDDNPDIDKYLGYGELWGFYYWNQHRLGAMVRNNLRPGDNKGAVQLDWSFPFPFIKNRRFSGYIQYFSGYGESLIDYNAYVNRIGIGFMLTDWN